MSQDLRAAVRLLRRRPGVSALVVLTLAIGISATTIVFSLADAILWRPLPFRDADRLIRVHVDAPLDPQRGSASSALAALGGAGVFEGLHPFALSSAIVNAGDEPQAVTIGELSPGLLETLAVNPVWGRDFAADEYQPGSAVVVVGAALWRRIPPDARRANDPLITVEGVPHTIVGVMPDGFEFPVSRVALWRPYVSGRPIPRIRALGRLKAGVTIEQAQAIAATVDPREPGQARPTTQVLPFVLVNATTATALRLLLGAVALLLLIAVANVANVMLAEAVRRDPEFAVRASLGASRWRLTRQLLAETLVIATIAAVAAAVASIWAIAALRTAVPYLWTFQALRPMAVDMRALAFAAAIAALAALGASGLSLLRASRRDLHRVLRVRAGDTPGHGRARGFLTAGQIAVTLVLLVSAGLLLNGFVRLSRVDHGFDPENLLQVYVQLPEWRYPTDVEMHVALERLRSETARLPEVASVTIANSIPPNLNFAPARDLGVSDSAARVLEGYVAFGRVDDAFFATLGIPVLSGRAFEPADRPDSQPVAVVSRALAQRLWPDGDAVGRRFRESAEAPWLTVVGIVGDVSNGVFERPIGTLAYYTPRTQAPPWWYEGVVVRTRANPARAVASLRAIVHRVLPDAPIVQVVTAYDTIAGANARVRFATFLMSAFAALALAVALIGVYGTFWCAVRQRTREIGVRIALGATQGHVLRSVLGASARLSLAGIAAGLAFVTVAARALQSFLFEVSPTDPGTLMAVAAFLAVSATAATYLPARHAARIDPVDALRQD